MALVRHLDEDIAENVARGMDPDAARQAALRRFGNVEAAKETVQAAQRNSWRKLLGDAFYQRYLQETIKP